MDQFEGHTPGPLACVELMAFAAGFAVEDGEGRTVARIMKTHGVERLPSRANAALFAAAPELLAEVHRLTAEADALRRERDELSERVAFVEQHLGVISGVLGSPEPLQIDDIAARLHLLIAERDDQAARLAEIEAQPPVAVIGDTYRLLWAQPGTMPEIVRKCGIKVGSLLYARPAPAQRVSAADLD